MMRGEFGIYDSGMPFFRFGAELAGEWNRAELGWGVADGAVIGMRWSFCDPYGGDD